MIFFTKIFAIILNNKNIKLRMYKEESDGFDHINIHQFGKTEIGRSLSNTGLSVLTTKQGDFTSVEGYIFYNILNCEKEVLKNLYDTLVQRYASNYLQIENVILSNFNNVIKSGLEQKLKRNSWIEKILLENNLPLVSYDNKETPKWFLNTNTEIVINFYKELSVKKENIQNKIWLYLDH